MCNSKICNQLPTCAHSSDVQCNLEIALLANDVQVNNEQRAGVSVTEEQVGLML